MGVIVQGNFAYEEIAFTLKMVKKTDLSLL